jgi:hypothetical protein
MPKALQDKHEQDVGLVIADSMQHFTYDAVYGGGGKAPHDITVNFNVNKALVDSFNTIHGTSYPLLPNDFYTMKETSVTIPAGKKHTPALKVDINPIGNFTADGPKYLLPITITDKSGGIKIKSDRATVYYVIQGNIKLISKSKWKLVDTDSYSTDGPGYPASNIIDGSTGSFWNTAYENPNNDQSTAPLPHYAVIDMGKSHTITGFKLAGRAGTASFIVKQNPKKITMKFSSDGTNWRDSEDFTLPFNAGNHTTKISLSKPVKARYFKFIINENVGGTSAPVTNFAEISAF